MRVSIERRFAIISAYKAGLSLDELTLLTGFEEETIKKILSPVKRSKEACAKEMVYSCRKNILSKT